VSGIGSDFVTNLNTGVGTYSVPVELPSGHRGRAPELALQYSSGAGQGAFGLGWTLPTLSIRRDLRNGFPRYGEEDVFLLNGTELVSLGDGLYRPEVDPSFQRVRRLGVGWEITDRQGTRFLLGTGAASQERHPDRAGESGVLAWLVDQVVDTTGNGTIYTYLEDGNRRYLHRIDYTKFRLEVSYEERPDLLTIRRAGFPQVMRWRGTRLAVHDTSLEPTLIRSYDFGYERAPLSHHSLLAEVRLTGYRFDDGPAADPEVEVAPPLRFNYALFAPERRRIESFRAPRGYGPANLNTGTCDVVDLEGFGLPGVLEASQAVHRYWPNRGGGQWGTPVRLKEFPRGASLSDSRVRFGDMDGEGRADLLVSDGALTGYYPGAPGVTWGRFRPYLRNRPTFDARSRHTRLLDADADGRVDALVSGGEGFRLFAGGGQEGWDPLPRAIPRRRNDPTFPDVSFADPRVRVADMTGDGLLDVVRVFRRHIEYWPSTGVGRWDERRLLFLTGDAPERFSPARCFLADVNGDGVTDVIYVDGDAIYLWINRQGEGASPAIRLRYPPPPATGTVRTADMLATGTDGLLFGLSQRPAQRETYRFLDFTGGTKPYLLNRIENGVGGRTEITYGASTTHRTRDRDAGQDWSTFLPRAVQVVNEVRRTDAVTGIAATTSFRYHEGHYDARAQRFVGFTVVDAIEDHGGGSLPARVRHHYLLGNAEQSPGIAAQRLHALRGQLHRKETFGIDESEFDERPYVVERTEWGVRAVAVAEDGREVLCAHPVQRAVERFERTESASRIVTDLVHDDFGNVLSETRTGSSPVPGEPDEVLELAGEYINDTTRWILGLPIRRTMFAGGQRLDDVRMYYDDLPLGEATQGLLTRRERLAFTSTLLQQAFGTLALPALDTLGYRTIAVAGGESEVWFDEYRADHDARGNVVRLRDAFGNASTIQYDAVHQLDPVRTENAEGHVHVADYHPRLGSIGALTDPAGNITRYEYTALGRVAREIRPGDTDAFPTVEYTYDTSSVPISTTMVRRRIAGQADSRRSVSYYDSRGNTLQTRGLLDDGTYQVSGLEIRDMRDLIIESRPAFASTSAAFLLSEGSAGASPSFQYDPLQRTTEVVNAAGQRSRALYTPVGMEFHDTQDNDATSPYANTPRRQRVDPFGRILEVEEVTDTGSVATSYAYDEKGRLQRIADANGSQLLTQMFDFAGRKVRVDHREAGLRRFLYDARGKLALYVDGEDRRVTWTFDDIGRKRTVAHEGVVVEQFTYDAGTGLNLDGRVARIEDRVGRQEFSYDTRGRTASTHRWIDGRVDPFEYTFEYDPDDRIVQTGYPDGGSETRIYDALGRLERMPGLIDSVDHDERGRRVRVAYASGLEETRVYDPLIGRLAEHRLRRPATGAELLHQRFTYDSSGNVLGLEDARAPRPGVAIASREFEYDALGRLTRVQGGPAGDSYDHAFEYDDVGNMTLHEAWRPEPLLHAGTQLTGVQTPGGPQVLFGYDANGCMTSRPGMSLSFGHRDLLERVDRDDGVAIEFAYDHTGRRLRKRVIGTGGTSDTLYIGEGLEVRPDGSMMRYVRDPDGSATRVITPSGSTVLHHDYLGNVVVVEAPATGGSQRVRYLPYGELRNPPTGIGEILFGGQRLDPETGLYYIRMRYYDPAAGRFLSPDPIAVTNAEYGRLRPLSLNPYLYALDNPQRYRDANGLWTFWEGFLTVLMVVAIVVVTAVTFGAAGVIALGVGAAVGALVGGLTTGSVDGALAGALLGFSMVATVLAGVGLGALIGFGVAGPAGALVGAIAGGALGGISAVIQGLGFIPSVRQSDTYKDILGYASWFNPWAWPGHIVGGVIFIINAIIYGVASLVTWGDPPEWADMDVSFEMGMVVTEGGAIRPGRAWNFGAFTSLNPNSTAIRNPDGTESADREFVLRHERGHMLNNAYFGILQVGRIGAGSQDDSFWEQLAESNVNPDIPLTLTDKDARRRGGGRGFGDVPWWNA
jgi:RHS repeat-associated protein